MNILYLCDEYPPCQHGGIGTVTQNLARELVLKGHKVYVCGFYPYYRKSCYLEDDLGVNVFRHFYGNKILLILSRHKYFGKILNIAGEFNAYTKFLKDFIIKNKIEIIEIPDFNEVFRYSGPQFINFPEFGIPSVIKVHGNYSFLSHINKGYYYNESIYEKENYLIQNSDKVLAISEFAKKVVKDIFKYSKDIKVIYNGISLSKQVRYKENSESKTVIFAGKLTEEKGVLSLIKAWKEVITEIPSARLSFYGKCGVEILGKINKLISDKTFETIELKGYVNRDILIEKYKSATCAIFPSYVESFGMTALESMITGCPTIFTKRGAGYELIRDGINGLLVDPDNTSEIANAIKFMLINRSEAIKMGEKGAQTIKERFNISKIAEDHIELYNEVLKEKRN
jgi:glycosyltransferase involved in cell wall biosynthesis